MILEVLEDQYQYQKTELEDSRQFFKMAPKTAKKKAAKKKTSRKKTAKTKATKKKASRTATGRSKASKSAKRKRDTLQSWKNDQRAIQLLKVLGEKVGWSEEQVRETEDELRSAYGNLYGAFEDDYQLLVFMLMIVPIVLTFVVEGLVLLL